MPLLLCLVALASLSAMTLTEFVLARLERQAGQAAMARVQARAAAEAAVTDAMQGWPAVATPTSPGAEVQLVALDAPGPVRGFASLRSLGGPVYALHGKGVRTDRSGTAIGFAELELLVLLELAGPDSVVRPRIYPRGWRILP